MPDESPISLGLTNPAARPADEPLPSVDALQFKRAQTGEARKCAACQAVIDGQFYQVGGRTICSACAGKIQAAQGTPKKVPLLRAVIYGVGAAIAGCILYAIPLAMGFQIGIVALAVGWMVGKAVRNGAYGIGGRPQQILAVALTYFAISTSVIPVVFGRAVQKRLEARSAGKEPAASLTRQSPQPDSSRISTQASTQTFSGGRLIRVIFMIAAFSPFLALQGSPIGGLISLFILFLGLQRAWALTARLNIVVTGPFPCSPTPA
jgi:hypothetical protein